MPAAERHAIAERIYINECGGKTENLVTWSAGEQQAPWFDDQMDYCITIEPEGADVSVTLSEHPAIAGQQPAFIPAVQGFEGMVRPR